MRALIIELLDMARIEKGSLSVGPVPTLESTLNRVWSLWHSGDNGSVWTYVKGTGRKLSEDTNSPKYIFAEPRVGYRRRRGEAREDVGL